MICKKVIGKLCCHFASKSRCYGTRYSPAILYQNSERITDNYATSPSPIDGSSFNGYIPIKELKISCGTSSAPGGQNVNKRSTRVDVRFHLASAEWIPDKIKQQLIEDFAHRVTKDGFLCIRSERTRSQHLNLADCLDKLRYSIRQSEKKVNSGGLSDETLEQIKWRQINAARKRLEEKRWRSEKRRDPTS
ncbi:hypothetical protein M514_06288 [Trichuris suis]|uniref:Large ribosomal subunit protein mL62 n=1 Tax=Trichuris suis TaxID=68888 RepID=A0A085NR59_9BILA|nr:hypothetical protein M513_06288 [Trichuris suis]KFD71955.1 hypothetical protein M514_06288 [Trichuris suis]KHJ43037.1 hypothetical protein D918_06896 [Trichuris suis]